MYRTVLCRVDMNCDSRGARRQAALCMHDITWSCLPRRESLNCELPRSRDRHTPGDEDWYYLLLVEAHVWHAIAGSGSG